MVGLHLYRRQVRERQISAAFLWEDLGAPKGAGRTRRPLHRSPSFWLELLAVLLIALVLASPRGCAGAAEHRVVVLDDSASMQAIQGPAKDALDHALRGMRARDRVSVVLSGPSPRMLIGPAALREEAHDAAARWQPAAASHDLGPAVDLALQLSDGGAITLISDRFEPQAWPAQVALVALGAPSPNMGLSHVNRVRASAEQDLVFAVVRSFSAAPLSGTLEIWAGEQRLAQAPLKIGPGESAERSFRVPHDAGTLHLRVLPQSADALQIDDTAWLAPLPARTLGLHNGLSEGRSAALGLDPEGERWVALVPNAKLVPLEQAHLALLEQDQPHPEKTWAISLSPQGAPSQALLGPFLVDKEHPVTRGMSLDGVVWSAPSVSSHEGEALITAGALPLLSQGQDGQGVVLHLDPSRSTLARSPDWPILLLNLAEARRLALPGLSASTTRVGASLSWRGAASGEWVLSDPKGTTRALPSRPTLDIGGLQRPGVWTLRRDQGPVVELAVNALDPLESDLSERSSGERAAESPPGQARDSSQGLADSALLILLLAVLGLDWWALRNDDRLFGSAP